MENKLLIQKTSEEYHKEFDVMYGNHKPNLSLSRAEEAALKTPDKIYTDNRGVYAELPIFSQADTNVEYIRKEALLE